jgi:YHS domain-containing protein
MRQTVFLLLALLGLHTTLLAQSDKRKLAFNLSAKHIAIQGYDPVAYFDQNKAVKGKAAHAVVYDGITYHFSSPQNMESFRGEPLKYEPQYGGWCAYAMGATGEKVAVDPETYKVVDGKLFLFYNRFLTNTLTSWNKDEKNLNKKATANWRKFFN